MKAEKISVETEKPLLDPKEVLRRMLNTPPQPFTPPQKEEKIKSEKYAK
jgi:hypothetical protein